MDLLQKLHYIQSVTGVQVEIPAEGLDDEDVQDIEEMYQVLTEGAVDFRQRELTLEFSRETVEQVLQAVRRGQGVTYSSMGGESLITLLDTDIPLGPANLTLNFVPVASERELQDMLNQMQDGDIVTLLVRVVTGRVVYPRWGGK